MACFLLPASLLCHSIQKIPEPFWIEQEDVDEEKFGQRQKESDVMQNDEPDRDQYSVEDVHSLPPLSVRLSLSDIYLSQ